MNFSWGICAICVLYIIDTLRDFICPKLQNVGHNENGTQMEGMLVCNLHYISI